MSVKLEIRIAKALDELGFHDRSAEDAIDLAASLRHVEHLVDDDCDLLSAITATLDFFHRALHRCGVSSSERGPLHVIN